MDNRFLGSQMPNLKTAGLIFLIDEEPQIDIETGMCKALVYGVLLRALVDATFNGQTRIVDCTGSPKSVLQNKARRWIMSDDRESFSFFWCCAELNVSPLSLRQRVRCGEQFAWTDMRWSTLSKILGAID